MSKEKHQSLTPATQWLKEHKIPFEERSYEYEEHGGTALAASACGIDHHHVIKTLIMEDENAKPLVILMHGDCEVSTKNLARQIAGKLGRSPVMASSAVSKALVVTSRRSAPPSPASS